MEIDIITQEEIPPEYLVKFNEGNKEFVFDVRTLVKDRIYHRSYRNPFTNTPLPNEIIKLIKKYNKDNMVVIKYCFESNPTHIKKLGLGKLYTLGILLLKILRKNSSISELVSTNFYTSSFEVFDNLNKTLGELDFTNKITISKAVKVYDLYNANVSWFRYAYEIHDTKIINIIDRKYYIKQENHIPITDNTFNKIMETISIIIERKRTDMFNNMKFIIKFDASFGDKRISAEHARNIIEMINDRSLNLFNDFILSIVGDKYNLNKDDELEGLYAIPKKIGDVKIRHKINITAIALFHLLGIPYSDN